MELYRLTLVFFVITSCDVTYANCPAGFLAPLAFTLEYAVWRGWQQALLYTPGQDSACQWAILRLMKCLSVNGVATALNVRGKSRFNSKLGLIVLLPELRKNHIEDLSKLLKQFDMLEMNTASYDWLVTARSHQDFKHANEVLNSTSIRFDQNIVVAYPHYKYKPEVENLGLCDTNFVYKSEARRHSDDGYRKNTRGRRYYFNSCKYDRSNQTCFKTEYERNYYRTTERFRNLTKNATYKKDGTVLPLHQSGMQAVSTNREFLMTNISRFSLRYHLNKWSKDNRFYGVTEGIHLVQYFKVRVNSTLYAHYLGNWNRDTSMSDVNVPYPVESRNFLGEQMIVGRCNSSGDDIPSLDDDGPSAPASLDDVLHFLTVRLNTTSVTRIYGMLGFRTYEGAWTGLLGGLMDKSVDLALEPVTAHPPRHQDMDFIFPIAETMCNIYIRHQETSTVRDIFLAPFSARLVACVVAVVAAAALTLVLISRFAPTPRWILTKPMGYTEALIWSTGILCQQGGTWTPPTPAASVVLIVCLFFAVVTYNAYAAFITSVLSVRVASMDTVGAVLHSPNFKIGYIRNGADQMYLMSTKDVQLNAFYIRGYSNAENLVSTAEEGLARAARQDYAFFAGQRAARSTLRSLSQARGRCAVRELPVHSTRAHLAFPLPRRSPYARPILISLLQLRSGGALARLEAALVPAMPQCAPPAGFASARAADVRSALILLLTGLIAALTIGISEYCWKNRLQLLKIFLAYRRRLVQLFNSIV